jgi:pyrimidine nucleoside transport protein
MPLTATCKLIFFKISNFLAYTDNGSGFVFGYLVNQKPFVEGSVSNASVAYDVMREINAFKSINGVFFFKVLSVIYFFSFFISMLFYLGAMQWVIGKIGWLLQVVFFLLLLLLLFWFNN